MIPLNLKESLTKSNFSLYFPLRFNFKNLNFKLNYGISDGIGGGQAKVELWDRYCESGGVAVKKEVLDVSISDTEATGTGSGFQELEVSIDVQTGSLAALLDSGVYQESCDGSFAQINCCVRTQLHIEERLGGHEANFLETPMIVNVDFEAGGTFGLNFLVMGSEDYCDMERGQRTRLNSLNPKSSAINLTVILSLLIMSVLSFIIILTI